MFQGLGEVSCRIKRQDRKYLEQRKRKTQWLKRYRYYVVFWVMSCLLLLFGFVFNETYSYFIAGAETREANYQAAHIRNLLKITPGKARAAFPAVGEPCGETRLVASESDGMITLDFGEVVENNSKFFNDVLRLHNISAGPLTVSWRLDGEIAALMNGNSGQFILLSDGQEPGGGFWNGHSSNVRDSVYEEVYSSAYDVPVTVLQEETSPSSLDFKLNAESAPGIYEGFLIINVNGNFLTESIPARVIVREKGSGHHSGVKNKSYQEDGLSLEAEFGPSPTEEGQEPGEQGQEPMEEGQKPVKEDRGNKEETHDPFLQVIEEIISNSEKSPPKPTEGEPSGEDTGISDLDGESAENDENSSVQGDI